MEYQMGKFAMIYKSQHQQSALNEYQNQDIDQLMIASRQITNIKSKKMKSSLKRINSKTQTPYNQNLKTEAS